MGFMYLWGNIKQVALSVAISFTPCVLSRSIRSQNMGKRIGNMANIAAIAKFHNHCVWTVRVTNTGNVSPGLHSL